MFLLRSLHVPVAMLVFLTGCGDADAPGVSSKLDFDGGFFDAPFPSAHRANSDGSLVVGDFPSADNPAIEQLIALVENGTSGFSPNAPIYIPFDGAIDTSRLPQTPIESTDVGSGVVLVDVEAESETFGELIPIEVSFKAEAETYTPANTLVVIPFQGAVLNPNNTYAVIVKRGVGDALGRGLFRPTLLDELLAGDPIAGAHAESVNAAFAELNAWRTESGWPATEDVAAATVFTTGDPLRELARFRQQVADVTVAPAMSWSRVDSYDNFCAVRATITLPNFQRGPKPYAEFPNGELAVDDEGRLVEQGRDTLEIMVSIPHGDMPMSGLPVVLYSGGADGTARQVLDRTTASVDPSQGGDGPPGQGPAKHLSARGVAAVGFPAPLAWDRHPDGIGGSADSRNVDNIAVFRDTIRQGILDFTTLVPLIRDAEIDASLCPEATAPDGSFHFDAEHLFLHGHGSGATIGSAAIALEPELRAAILSGNGGSWIYRVATAESSFDLAAVAHPLWGYDDGDVIDIFDPALMLFQTALSSVEVMNWGRATVLHPLPTVPAKQLLLIEGVIDSYHVPRMVNAYAMSAGLDLAGPEAEPTAAEDYALVGTEVLTSPVTANIGVGQGVTAVTIQRQQNGEDGHDVAFELDDVKYRYSCFIGTAVTDGVATVPPPRSDPAGSCR